MAAFGLVIALALCALYFVVDAETVDGDSDSSLAVQNPGAIGPETGDGDNPSTTDPSDNSTITPIIGTFVPPGTTNKTDNSTGMTKPPIVNLTTTLPPNGTEPPTTGTEPPTTGPPTIGTTPSTNGTKHPNGTKPSTTRPPPPPTGTTPPTPGNPPSLPPDNPVPPVPMPPTAWLYPGILLPPMPSQQSSGQSMDYFDQQMSDQSGDILIEDFQETITIHKKTIRKHQDKFEKADSDISQSNDSDYVY